MSSSSPHPERIRRRLRHAVLSLVAVVAAGMVVVASPARAADGPSTQWSVLETRAVSDALFDVAMAPDGETLYAVAPGLPSGDGTLYALDPEAGLIWSATVPRAPAAITVSPDGKRVYVAQQGVGSAQGGLAVVETTGSHEVTQVDDYDYAGYAPTALAMSADGESVYALDPAVGAIGVIDAETLDVEDYVNMLYAGLDFAASTTSDAVFTVATFENRVGRIDMAEKLNVADVEVGDESSGIALSPDEKTLWVAESADNRIAVVDVDTFTIVDRIDVGSYPMGTAASPDGKVVIAANTDSSTVSIIDTATHETYQVPVGDAPLNAAFSPDGSFAYVANADGTLSVLAAPASVTPASQSLVGHIGQSVDATAPLVPVAFRGAVTYGVTPVLPDGLELEPTTGVVTGKPTGPVQPETEYTITATGADRGVATSTLRIEIKAGPPAAATAVSVVPGARQAFVTWQPSALTGGGGKITYTVTASPGGATCTTSETSCFLVGLPVGEVTVSVVASTAGGASAESSAEPVRIVDDIAGDDVPEPTKGTSLEVASADGSAVTEARRGQRLTLSLSGFAPFTNADVHLYSEPVRLGTVTTDAEGTGTLSVRIPRSATVEDHHLVASGFAADGTFAFGVSPLSVVADGDAGDSAEGGSDGRSSEGAGGPGGGPSADGSDQVLPATGAGFSVGALLIGGGLLAAGLVLATLSELRRRRRT